ncbi:GTP-binding protein [Cyclospora cayetanensis]|uniref:GTPase Der n=1 Tax=Cyclospora cayetanensis TaxID=88456 RepID=A0A1D3CVD3_9EIME|nr:GTP-binding protein [Cyclospora cayetanensis]
MLAYCCRPCQPHPRESRRVSSACRQRRSSASREKGPPQPAASSRRLRGGVLASLVLLLLLLHAQPCRLLQQRKHFGTGSKGRRFVQASLGPLGGARGGALVSATAGTTRDCLIAALEWRGEHVEIADTGGLLMDDKELGPLALQLRDQVAFALQQAACAVLVVDGRAGVQSDDEYLAEMARHLKLPVVLCVNKMENPKTAATEAQVFWRLGLGEPLACSAATGTGVGELLDKCMDLMAKLGKPSSRPSLRTTKSSMEGLREHVTVALVGRPNAGKSRLLNRLLDCQRSVVSPLPGTTRDAVDEFVMRGEQLYCLVDTAGIRRASMIRRNSSGDLQMAARAKTAALRADVCLLVIDASVGLTHQDVNLAKMLEALGRAVVVVLNKWDVALQTEAFKQNEAVDYVRRVLFPVHWAEVLFVSAETGSGVAKIWSAVDAAAQQHKRRLTTALLNFVVRDAVAVFPPPLTKDGKRGKIYLAQQVASEVPTMVVFCNKGEFFPEAYRRYLDFAVDLSGQAPAYHATVPETAENAQQAALTA